MNNNYQICLQYNGQLEFLTIDNCDKSLSEINKMLMYSPATQPYDSVMIGEYVIDRQCIVYVQSLDGGARCTV